MIRYRGAYLAQHQFMTDFENGWCGFFAGWGAGKSLAGAFKHVYLHLWINDRSWSAVLAPSSVLGTTIRALERVFNKWQIPFVYHPTGKDNVAFRHVLADDRPILLISTDKGENITGFEASHIWVDEAARIKPMKEPTRCPWTQIPGRIRGSVGKIKQVNITSTHEGLKTYVYKNMVKEPIPGSR